MDVNCGCVELIAELQMLTANKSAGVHQTKTTFYCNLDAIIAGTEIDVERMTDSFVTHILLYHWCSIY